MKSSSLDHKQSEAILILCGLQFNIKVDKHVIYKLFDIDGRHSLAIHKFRIHVEEMEGWTQAGYDEKIIEGVEPKSF